MSDIDLSGLTVAEANERLRVALSRINIAIAASTLLPAERFEVAVMAAAHLLGGAGAAASLAFGIDMPQATEAVAKQIFDVLRLADNPARGRA